MRKITKISPVDRFKDRMKTFPKGKLSIKNNRLLAQMLKRRTTKQSA